MFKINDQALIADYITEALGILHDLHFMEGLFPIPTPVVLGHESSAVVVAVGEGITYVEPGDHVITCPSVFCGACPLCLTGHANLCENTEVRLAPGQARRMTWKGGESLGGAESGGLPTFAGTSLGDKVAPIAAVRRTSGTDGAGR